MLTSQDLARTALRAACEVRRKAKINTTDPICVYDLSESLGVEVWFVAGASFGGAYAKGYNRLLIPSERPPGRRAFTCAHELGHLWFGHGTQFDDLDFDKPDHLIPEERLVNMFAGYLMMPRAAVTAEFAARQLLPEQCNSLELYAVACQLGVGYETMIRHLRWSLNLISHARMGDLCAIPPKEIRRAILGADLCRHLIIADLYWRKVAIDLEVGDIAVVPSGASVKGGAAQWLGSCAEGEMIRAVQPGVAQCLSNDITWAAMIRVARKNYIGRGAYRHMEDPDYVE